MSQLLVKCKKCRSPLADTKVTRIISGHEILLNGDNIFHPDKEKDCSDTVNTLYFMEQTLPDWMISQIDQENWIKGKLHCDKCGIRLGTFDFVGGRKCTCKRFVLPPVHLIKNKLDFTIIDDDDTTNIT